MWLSALLLACPGGGSGKESNLVVMADVTGYWTGDWGDMVLAEGEGGSMIGAYSHDEGTVKGTYDEQGLFTGWWCETPSREPDNDAGSVEFTFYDGGATLDGRYSYGTYEDTWKEDWDLEHVEGTGPEELVARLAEAEAFCDEP